MVAAIVDPPFRPGLVDRYLVAAARGGIQPILCVTKVDLRRRHERGGRLPRWPVCRWSIAPSGTAAGIGEQRGLLAGSLAVFAGHSGVGKSSLLNAVAGEDRARTGAVSDGSGKGRHTTTSSKLHELPNGARIIDTPGIREFERLSAVTSGRRSARCISGDRGVFACRFRDCKHNSEPGCGVLAAVESGRYCERRGHHVLCKDCRGVVRLLTRWRTRQLYSTIMVWLANERLRTAVIGTGFVGRVHVEAIRRLGFVDIAAIVDVNIAQAEKYAKEFGADKAVADYKEVLADPTIDAVDICTPNTFHAPFAKAAMEAGKHVICEKPLATSAAAAAELVSITSAKKLRNCACHNLRMYPQVQNMRRMVEAGDIGDILVVQGTYSQDWLLFPTDYNWRIETKDNGPSRTVADVGSHFCDMAEHVTGLRITEVCADLQTFHKTRLKPKGQIEAFAGKTLTPDDYTPYDVDTEDFGAVVFRMGDRARGAYTASQVSAGRKNGLSIEIYGSKSGVAWNQERPDELWIGHRNTPNCIIIQDPSLLMEKARPYADLPGGHSEGYDDTFKQIFRRVYGSILDPAATPEYPQFADSLRQLTILEAELLSSKSRAWVEVK